MALKDVLKRVTVDQHTRDREELRKFCSEQRDHEEDGTLIADLVPRRILPRDGRDLEPPGRARPRRIVVARSERHRRHRHPRRPVDGTPAHRRRPTRQPARRRRPPDACRAAPVAPRSTTPNTGCWRKPASASAPS